MQGAPIPSLSPSLPLTCPCPSILSPAVPSVPGQWGCSQLLLLFLGNATPTPTFLLSPCRAQPGASPAQPVWPGWVVRPPVQPGLSLPHPEPSGENGLWCGLPGPRPGTTCSAWSQASTSEPGACGFSGLLLGCLDLCQGSRGISGLRRPSYQDPDSTSLPPSIREGGVGILLTQMRKLVERV